MRDDLENLEKNPQLEKAPEIKTPVAPNVELPKPEVPKPETPKPENNAHPDPFYKPAPQIPPTPSREIPQGPFQNQMNEPKQDLTKAFFEQSRKPAAPAQQETPTSSPFSAPAKTEKQVEAIEISPIENKGSGSKKMLVFLLIFLLLAIAALGGYYFWLLNSSSEQAVVEPPKEAQAPVVITPTEKYSLEKPNYLVLDIATMSPQAIETSLEAVASELKGKPQGSLYEFVAVDANNAPIAFPIFATAAKWNLSPTLLEDLGESFSLYFYNDTGETRLAVAASITNKESVRGELLKQETAFITDASFLFLGNTVQAPASGFKDGSYNNNAIRYLNIDEAKLLSVDYAVTDSKMVVGTSKNTTRSVLDKISGTLSSSATNPTPVPEANETPVTSSDQPVTDSSQMAPNQIPTNSVDLPETPSELPAQ
jgi:hypothetical protein